MRSNVLLSDELRASLADLGVAQLLAKHCGGAAAKHQDVSGSKATSKAISKGATSSTPGASTAAAGAATGAAGGAGAEGTSPADGAPVMAAAGPDGVAQMYAAPEQLAGQRCSTAADMYRCAWEPLAGPYLACWSMCVGRSGSGLVSCR